MPDATLLWTQYGLVTGLIVYAGAQTVRHADRIAELTGIGRGWVGLTLVAVMTSIPELITGASAIALFRVPDIAAGDVYGSLVFNLLLVALLDALSPQPLFSIVSASARPRAWAALALTLIAAAALLFAPWTPVVAGLGLISLLILPAYVGSLWILRPRGQDRPRMAEPRSDGLRTAATRFALHGVIVVSAASFLPTLGAQLASETGLLQTFVGNLLVAASTSMPELVTTVAAARIRSFDLALGNLLGSNLFDVVILAMDDAIYRPGPLFQAISQRHLISAAAALAMTSLLLLGLYRRPARKAWLSIESWLIVLAYAATVWAFIENR